MNINSYCSPGKEKKNSCLDKKQLEIIAKDYNKYKNDKIINPKLPKKKLYNDIKKELDEICKEGELCWIEQNFIKAENKNILEESFKPEKPMEWYYDKKTWLNTYDIVEVLEQYEEPYKEFKFLGVFPIDFQSRYPGGKCIGDDLCTFHINDLNKTKFAMILNLDKHDQPGSHWVALFCCLDPKNKQYGIYYYDSTAYPPPLEVQTFMKSIYLQAMNKNSNIDFPVRFNKIQKQYKNSECGMFSILFVIKMLNNNSFDDICQNMERDDNVNNYRNVLYRPNLKINKIK